MISCTNVSALRMRRALLAICCACLAACVGEVRRGEPLEEEDAGATAEDGGAGRSDARAADAAADTSKTDTDAKGSSDSGRDTGPSSGGPVDSGPSGQNPADAGNPPGQDTGTADAGTPNGTQLAVFVAVGYSGVRMVSRDLGRTWGDVVTSGGSGDDENLLRTVAYGNGVFVAVGSKIWTSPNGVQWTARTSPGNGQWFGGVEYGNGLFVAAGGYGASMYSSDGLSWQSGGARETDPARSLAFGNGMFIAAADSNRWWSTTDGKSWAVQSSGHSSSKIVFCKDQFSETSACTGPEGRNGGEARTAFGAGVYVSVSYAKIERSENGTDWTTVTSSPAAPLADVAFGYVAQ